MMRALPFLVAMIAAATACANEAFADEAAQQDSLAVPDSSAVQETSAPDTTTAPAPASSVADSATAPAESVVVVPPYRPDPAIEALSMLRPERTADVEQVLFRDRDNAIEPPGLVSLATLLRLSPGVRTREISQGPAVESFDLSGAGSSRSALLLRGAPLALPETSGPQSQEIVLSEIDGFSVVRDGAAALYGPDAVGGAMLALPRHPIPEELTSRATAEEGVDDWQRGTFQIAKRAGTGGFFGSAESRRMEGFFPSTKEVDRHFAAAYAGRVRGLEGSIGFRHFESDGRHGSFDPDSVRSVLAKRNDLFLKLFRPVSGGGALLEAELVREKLETGLEGPTPMTREFLVPALRLTADLPALGATRWMARAEGRRVRIENDTTDDSDPFLRGAALLRGTWPSGESFATATARIDRDEGRPSSAHGRLEGEWARGKFAAFAIGARGERLPDRGAVRPDDPEVHTSLTVGVRIATGPLRWRVAGFARDVEDARREPTFEELRGREPVLDGPEGDAEIRGGTVGFESDAFAFPGVAGLGDLRLRSSFTSLQAENATTDAPLPRRAERTWTGEGSLERRFFSNELLARLRGRLAHLAERVDADGESVNDAWVTDVLLEGEVGDAIFFYRFHDLLERADEIEPGIRLPGFSRMWGVTWRFIG